MSSNLNVAAAGAFKLRSRSYLISRFKIYKNTFIHNALQQNAPLTCAFSE